MLTFFLVVIAVILATIGLVKLVDTFIPQKFKPALNIALWVLIGFLGYQTYTSIYEPIQFNKIKNKRYARVIKNLIDIRDSQLAHKQVVGQFTDNFDSLVKFIDSAQFTITQRRDSTVKDKILSKQYGVDMFKELVFIDTLGYVAVKDSLFKDSDRYRTMKNVPGTDNEIFTLESGFIIQNNIRIPVFEASVTKNVILADQNKDLLMQENQVVSVDGVNGDKLIVGSMEEVNTNGNWPKNYGSAE